MFNATKLDVIIPEYRVGTPQVAVVREAYASSMATVKALVGLRNCRAHTDYQRILSGLGKKRCPGRRLSQVLQCRRWRPCGSSIKVPAGIHSGMPRSAVHALNPSKSARPRGRQARLKETITLDQYLAAARSTLVRLEPADAYAATQRGALLVDIRPEFQRRRDGEIPAAIVVERNHLEWRLHPESAARIPEAINADVQWIVVCDEGYASSLAAAVLQALGLHRATDVVGGLRAWRTAGLPLGPPDEVSAPRLAPEADSAGQVDSNR
jgi:rhodanese-related sulfurtransferase